MQPIVEENAPACVLAPETRLTSSQPEPPPSIQRLSLSLVGIAALYNVTPFFQIRAQRGVRQPTATRMYALNIPRFSGPSIGILSICPNHPCHPSSSSYIHSLHTYISSLLSSARRHCCTSATLRLISVEADIGMSTSPLCSAIQSLTLALLIDREVAALFSSVCRMSANMYISPLAGYQVRWW